ncbi:Response regulator receiver domain-containing protein [Malonomonas rubra DSM 5091]|uniref:Response regulator receiver domain-containing protein n=1 Tax=Malonomonas rubra DSM 5091 TaxID=1122189 RepID=A0A1M6IUV8_MALRU|nr:response regulator [Malonomonas rubra]SHJ38241.1 Response regulator receiver domain-containing protein [Malonomonas rubra DSM 5091]
MKIAPRKVLLIDSEMLIHLAVSQAYRDKGPYFITAASNKEALTKMDIFSFDLFLLALDLKDVESLELLKTIDERFPEAPVILMTNGATEYCSLLEKIEETRKHGTWQLIEKPFNLDILTVLIERCLHEQERDQISKEQDSEGHEKRCYLRSSHVQTIQLLIDAADSGYKEEKSVRATLTDVSDGGLGLVTKYPLKKSQSIRFAGGSISKSGVVAWTALMDNHICRAGVQFC